MSEEATTTVEMTTPAPAELTKKIDGYVEAIGRRKTATAQVRVSDAKKMKFIINGEEGISKYFPTEELAKILRAPFDAINTDRQFEVSVIVSGGGTHAQAEAIRHGISRALVKLDETAVRPTLKRAKFLKRDPRKKERKKPGLRKARKRAQWSKR